MRCLKESGYWFGYSFLKRHKNKGKYLVYLDQDRFPLLQKKIDKISIYSGDFNYNLKLFDNNFYDLIYVSNIFDSRKYCSEVDLYLRNIQQKMREGGYLLVVTMDRPEKMIQLLKKYEFQICKKEVSKFGMLKTFFLNKGEYGWSFLLFRKIS